MIKSLKLMHHSIRTFYAEQVLSVCALNRKSQSGAEDIEYFHLFHPLCVSQSRVKLLQSHYFKHTTSSSAAEELFQSPVYLEFNRARRTPFGEISRLHMSRLPGLKIPTMLCARTNFPKYVAEDVRRGLSYDAHLHTC